MKQNKTIVFCAGGTGGHLFPAQQLAEELKNDYNVLFAGKGLRHNPYFHQHKYSFWEVNAATFAFSKPWSIVKGGCAIIHGFLQSMKLLRKEKPALMIGFGSFFSLPLLLAAKVQRIPIVLHEQNLLPGRVNRLFSPHSLFLATAFAETQSYIKGRFQQVQFPLRLRREGGSRKEAASYFGLEENRCTLLIFGGSQGASFLNELANRLAPVLQELGWQCLHFVGKKGNIEETKLYYKRANVPAVVKSFEKQMDNAYHLADIALCRSGAGTIHELLEAALPAILIPFPFATDNHQTKNAEFFSQTVGGGWCYQQKEITFAKLTEILRSCDQEKLLVKKKKIEEYFLGLNGKIGSFASLIRTIL